MRFDTPLECPHCDSKFWYPKQFSIHIWEEHPEVLEKYMFGEV